MDNSNIIGTDWKMVILLIILAIALSIGIGILCPPARASVYVEQGMKINQTEVYDLSGVYGFSGELGWWKNWYDEGSDTEEPDKIIDLNDMNYYNVTLDPAVWNLGNWYQWDGVGKNNHGNTFVFKVQPKNENVTVTPTKTVTPSGKTTVSPISVPSEVPVYTVVVTAAPVPSVTAYYDPNQVLATQIPTETPIMVKKSPLNPVILILGLIGFVVYWGMKRAE